MKWWLRLKRKSTSYVLETIFKNRPKVIKYRRMLTRYIQKEFLVERLTFSRQSPEWVFDTDTSNKFGLDNSCKEDCFSSWELHCLLSLSSCNCGLRPLAGTSAAVICQPMARWEVAVWTNQSQARPDWVCDHHCWMRSYSFLFITNLKNEEKQA